MHDWSCIDQMIKNFEEENLIDTKQNWLVQGNLGWMNFEQQLFSVTNTATGRWKFSKWVKQTNLTCICKILEELEQSSSYISYQITVALEDLLYKFNLCGSHIANKYHPSFHTELTRITFSMLLFFNEINILWTQAYSTTSICTYIYTYSER